jgi:hypothetical protein
MFQQMRMIHDIESGFIERQRLGDVAALNRSVSRLQIEIRPRRMETLATSEIE